MNKKFQAFVEFLDGNSICTSDGELILSPETGIDESYIQDIFTGVGCSFNSQRSIRNGKVYIPLVASEWESQCPIYETWQDLFSSVEASSNLPVDYYIVNQGESRLSSEKYNEVINIYCSMRKLLAKLADQCEPQQGNGRGSRNLSFVIESDSGVVKYNFKPTLSWCDLEKIPADDKQLLLIEKLTSLIELGDSQDSERKSVMRSAFHEIVSVCSVESDIFGCVINSVVNFHKRYEEHHEIFIKRFSINKILNEINNNDLNYTSKINEILSSAQNKALTIPGALIIIGAVMKIDRIADGVVVAIGMLITTVIVHRSLNVHNSTFNHITKQVDLEFKRYDVLNEKVEIRSRANDIKRELEKLLEDATKNTVFMRRSIWFISVLTLFFIFFVTTNPIESSVIGYMAPSVEAVPVNVAPVDVAPVDVAPVDVAPVETAPIESISNM